MKHVTAVTLLALSLAACTDTTGPAAPTVPVPAAPSAEGYIARFGCDVSVQAGTVSCRELQEGLPGGPSLAILGLNQVQLKSSNVVSDSLAGRFSMDVTLQNLRTYPIGTPDGTTATGSKVFFHEGPRVTGYNSLGDTGSVWVGNADGTGHFSKADQPYHFYPQILEPSQISAPERWEFHYTPGVARWSFIVYVFTRFPTEPVVPSVAPDTVPASIYAASKIVNGDSLRVGPFLRDIVLVMFREGATPDERLAAVNRTNGRVVGGMRVGDTDGIYFVRVPDNGTTAALDQALANLALLPQVEFAGVESLFDPTDMAQALYPSDDFGWKRGDWVAHPDSALADRKWGLTAIAAPHAWSCTTGDPTVRIGVLDNGFHAHEDLSPGNPQSDWARPTTNDHGVGVASVIGAMGNNETGMTGVMWQSDLRFYDYAVGDRYTLSTLMAELGRVVRSGARVINVSLGTPWPKGYFPANTAKDSAFARQYGNAMRTTLRLNTLALLAYDPLLVLSAGNEARDAYFSGFPMVVSTFPDRVLVVGGVEQAIGSGDFGGNYRLFTTDSSGVVLEGSGYGSLVEVAAPGEGIGVLTNAGPSAIYETGTSYAAPLVSGIAGLMLSLDKRLSAAELKDLIIIGANLGGRSVVNGPFPMAPLPIVNAYQSLRLVAERPGAGLCGNPVWQDSAGVVRALRGESWTGQQQLFTETGQSGMSAQHGTRRLRFASGYARQFTGTGWAASTDAGPNDNATLISRQARSIRGDTVVTAAKRQTSQTEEWFDVKVNGATIVSIMGPSINFTSVAAPRRCVQWPTTGSEWADCLATAPVRPDQRTTVFNVAYSDARREIVLAVRRDSSAWNIEESFFFFGGYYQRNYSFDRAYIDTRLYFIPIDEPAAVRTLVYRGLGIDNIGFSEDGQALTMRWLTFASRSRTTPEQTFSTISRACRAGFHRVEAADLPVIFQAPVVNSTLACYPDAAFAPGASVNTIFQP